ncbi:hypothetical protein BGZ74_011396 [Mortierella antarctica]|nr:hypothetical protein BGZ74_011396 [Mortierella antarctica]KAG0349868.1 hypothetical protein BG005_010601 [Podila minutissima]
MTDSDFDESEFDADFDAKDISSILKDIDNANLALDTLDVRADKLTASLASLLKAQSQPNPFQHVETAPLEGNGSALPQPTRTPANTVASLADLTKDSNTKKE